MKKLHCLFLAVGVVLFVILLHKTGVSVVLKNIQTVGWMGIATLVILEVLAHTANTRAWWFTFAENRQSIRLQHLFRVRLAGEAINYLTPTAMGGEFLKALLLKKKLPLTDGLATVTIAKLSQAVALGVFIIGGLSLIVPRLNLSPMVQDGLILVIFMGIVALSLFFVVQRLGLFAGLLRILNYLRIRHRFLDRIEEPARILDHNIARFYAGHGKRFWASVFWFFLGWIIGVIETYLILDFLHLPATAFRAITIEVLSRLITSLLFFVPGNLGTQEGGQVLIFSLLGLDAVQGFSLGVIRRIRELIWVGIGLLILAYYQQTLKAESNGQPSAMLRERNDANGIIEGSSI